MHKSGRIDSSNAGVEPAAALGGRAVVLRHAAASRAQRRAATRAKRAESAVKSVLKAETGRAASALFSSAPDPWHPATGAGTLSKDHGFQARRRTARAPRARARSIDICPRARARRVFDAVAAAQDSHAAAAAITAATASANNADAHAQAAKPPEVGSSEW